MYIPRLFKEIDFQKTTEFIRQHSFGILVSSVDGLAVATHLPFHLIEKEGELYLQTHLARANPQWKTLSETTDVLVIFQGANTYISPTWYDHLNVPTMNYQVAHVHGKPRIVQDTSEVYELLKHQIEQQESQLGQRNPGAQSGQAYNIASLPEKFLHTEMRGLVGLEVKVARMEASFKLSQNRDEANYRNIIDQLDKSNQPDDKEIAKAMQQVYDTKAYNQKY